jgi:hypothetical protein
VAGRRARSERPPRRPDPEPLEIDEAKVIAVGTIAWFVAWAVLLVLHGRLEDHDREWWIWTCVAGLFLGLWGYLLVRKRIEARKAGRGEDPAPGDAPRGPGRRRRADS